MTFQDWFQNTVLPERNFCPYTVQHYRGQCCSQRLVLRLHFLGLGLDPQDHMQKHQLRARQVWKLVKDFHWEPEGPCCCRKYIYRYRPSGFQQPVWLFNSIYTLLALNWLYVILVSEFWPWLHLLTNAWSDYATTGFHSDWHAQFVQDLLSTVSTNAYVCTRLCKLMTCTTVVHVCTSMQILFMRMYHGTILSPTVFKRLKELERHTCAGRHFFFFHSRVGVSASEHLLGSIDHVEEAIFVLLIPVDLGQRRRHARQALVVDDQVEGLRGCQLHSVPERFRGRETKDVIQNVNYHCMCTYMYHQLRARRALMLFNDVPLRTRRALMPSRLCM